MDEAGFSGCRQILEDEILLLKSMYEPDEITVSDNALEADNNGDIQVGLNLRIQNANVDLVVQFCSTYPLHTKPSVLVRSNDVNDKTLNKELRAYIDSLPLGEPLTLPIIQWIQENSLLFTSHSSSGSGSLQRQTEKGPQVWERLWIYSHHLYSMTKRRNIASEAKSLKLRGFFISGKPGIILIEGTKENCQLFWETISKYGWKKLVIRFREQLTDPAFMKLPVFKEVCLVSTDGHTLNYSELKKLLLDMGLDYGFQLLLGI